jgi:outer membrane lipoprotein-sorting protein
VGVLANRPVLRWLVPAGVLAAVAGVGVIATALRASGDTPLPSRSPAQLLADVQTGPLPDFSGTVLERADLGLPALPEVVGGDGSSQFASLVSGTHTLRVWYAGPEQVRIALLGALGESDLIHNGTDLWTWSSTDNSATHAVVPPRPQGSPGMPQGVPSVLPTTPQQAASDLLAALDPSTSVTVGAPVTVAGRSAYTLVISPRDPASLVSQVRIAVDGAKYIPLRVQAYARGFAKPAFEIGFIQVNFERPDAAMFRFNPPPRVTIRQLGTPKAAEPNPTGTRATVIGSGWTAVVAARLPIDEQGQLPLGLGSLVRALPVVHGGFGDGHLLQARLFTALITADGRIMIGAVDGARLLIAANSPAAKLTAPK